MLSTHTAQPLQQVPPADRFIDDVVAANMLGLSRSYLRQLRLTGGGCRFSRFGRAVRYRVGDLLDWAADNTVRSTSEAA